MNVETKITITIGETVLELGLEEARELRDALCDAVGKQVEYQPLPYNPPYPSSYPTTSDWSSLVRASEEMWRNHTPGTPVEFV